MRQSIPLLACTLGTVFAIPRGNNHSWQPWGPGQGYGQPQALYSMTNDVSGNKVVAVSIGNDGSVSAPVFYATGGVGSNYVSPVDGSPHFPDALSAQDAVVTAGDVSAVVLPADVL